MSVLTITRRFGLCCLAILPGCSSLSLSNSEFGSGLPRVTASPEIEEQERAMFQRLNRDRGERDLPAITYDPRLADVARVHSADMRDQRFFQHQSPTTGSVDDRLNRAGYLFLTARENLSEAPDVQAGQDSLLESPGHHANIMATDTTHVGIGIVRGGLEARENLMITQVFARPGRAESAQAARAALLQRVRAERKARGLPQAETHPVLQQLAKEQIEKLDEATSPQSVEDAGRQIQSALTAEPQKGIKTVVVGAQLLPDSESFAVPEPLARRARARFGLAVRKVAAPGGRPMLQVLVLVGE